MKKVLMMIGILLFISQSVIAVSIDDFPIIKDQKTLRESSYDLNGKNADFRPILPGKTLTVADIKGPGAITHFWCTIAHNEKYSLRKLVVRMYWDGEENPSVECPIGDFFGVGHGLGNPEVYHYSCAVFSIGTIAGFNSFWPMPFAKSAKITVTNEGEKKVDCFYYYVDYYQDNNMDTKTMGYFHAQYKQAVPCVTGQDYLLMETEGKGQYMGCSLSIQLNTKGWWGEGDDKIFIDGDKEPTLIGTGSEDYFCGAWCYGKSFAYQYFGCPLRGADTPGGKWNVYRYHIEDPIRFTKSIKVALEHGDEGWNNQRKGENNNYYSVSYWYQTEPHKKLEALPSVTDRLPVEVKPPATPE